MARPRRSASPTTSSSDRGYLPIKVAPPERALLETLLARHPVLSRAAMLRQAVIVGLAAIDRDPGVLVGPVGEQRAAV